MKKYIRLCPNDGFIFDIGLDDYSTGRFLDFRKKQMSILSGNKFLFKQKFYWYLMNGHSLEAQQGFFGTQELPLF